jgi:hypothetical protein
MGLNDGRKGYKEPVLRWKPIMKVSTINLLKLYI